ncbi:VanZ family protein [Pelatocladus sp. BLCC-F211]|uniref:VanZ family protein n=1 Tax=Pelatocladus sp. BLCC-F211 TaxID=3342752 RepID=UPI0035B7D013
MNKRQIVRNAHFVEFTKNYALIAMSILVILVATLYPCTFFFPNDFSWQELIASFSNASSFQDQVNNILLFIPLGFFASSVLQRKRVNLALEILIVILISTGLSTIVEVLQVFLPGRTPTPADIINNSIGGFVGWLCFNWFYSQNFAYTLARIENNTNRQINQKIAVFCLGYILLSSLNLVFWQSTTYLSNWNLNYPLTIGNEATGNRPWQGYVSEVNITDRAMSAIEVTEIFADKNYFDNFGNSLLAAYKLDKNGKSYYRDKSGNLPKLLWRIQPSGFQENRGALLSSTNWLETADSVKKLNKRISHTSEFTISTIVATSDTNQTGPARIVSISIDHLRRNFTLGQQGTALNLRLRTPITGENAGDIKLNIPNVFTDKQSHHIIISYFRSTIQVYVDNLQDSYSFNLLDLIPIEHKIFYYALNFIPLGIYLALLSILAKHQQIIHRLLLIMGILLPSLMLEVFLVSANGKEISWRNILIGIFFTASTALILRIRAAMLVKKVA